MLHIHTECMCVTKIWYSLSNQATTCKQSGDMIKWPFIFFKNKCKMHCPANTLYDLPICIRDRMFNHIVINSVPLSFSFCENDSSFGAE